MLFEKNGEIKSARDWVYDIDPREMDIRGISAKEIFKEDFKSGVYQRVTPKYCDFSEIGDCGDCPLKKSETTDCKNKPLHRSFL